MSENNATLTAMAKELRDGDSISRSARIPVDEIITKKVKRKLAAMRNSMNQIAARVRETTERDYRIESGQYMTYDGTALILNVTMTCMNDEGEDDI